MKRCSLRPMRNAVIPAGSLAVCAVAILVSTFFMKDGLDDTKAIPVPGPTVTKTVPGPVKTKKVPGPVKTVIKDYPQCPPDMLNGLSYEDSLRMEQAGGCIWHP